MEISSLTAHHRLCCLLRIRVWVLRWGQHTLSFALFVFTVMLLSFCAITIKIMSTLYFWNLMWRKKKTCLVTWLRNKPFNFFWLFVYFSILLFCFRTYEQLFFFPVTTNISFSRKRCRKLNRINNLKWMVWKSPPPLLTIYSRYAFNYTSSNILQLFYQ